MKYVGVLFLQVLQIINKSCAIYHISRLSGYLEGTKLAFVHTSNQTSVYET
jgi:hypothetical protein